MTQFKSDQDKFSKSKAEILGNFKQTEVQSLVILEQDI